jgi:hypothetical protein
MNESKDISSGDRSRHARDVVKRYVEMNYQLGRGLRDLIEAETEYEVDKAFREERCLSIANECLIKVGAGCPGVLDRIRTGPPLQ